MDSIPYDSIILLGVLLVVSGYFAISELALASVNKIRLRSLADNSNQAAKRAYDLIDNYEQTNAAIMIGNTIVNIAIAVISAKIAFDFLGNQLSTLIATIFVVATVVLLFGKVLPKSLVKNHAEKYLMLISTSIAVIMKVFYPLTWAFARVNQRVSKRFHAGVEEQPKVTDEDVKAMVQMGEEEGTFLAQEKELLNNAIEFDDIVVKDILTPRPYVIAVPDAATPDQVKDIFIREQYSRMPVYEGSIDNIVGVISHRDFFPHYVQKRDFPLKEIMRKPYFVIGSVKISDLLKELQKNKIPLAIVLDEYGGTSGIISIEDIIEEIVGDIWDEHDENENTIEILKEGKMRVDGKLPIEEFCTAIGIDIPETNSNTLSGWVMDSLGFIPKKGEIMFYQNLKIIVEDVRSRRIQTVIVEVQEEQQAVTQSA